MRRPTSADIDAMPGVSISVATRRLGDGQSTSRWSTSLGAARRAGRSPARRRAGRPAAAPARRRAGTSRSAAAGPARYQVTTRVHSPASDGRDLLAHQRVQQRRLARLDLAGDGDPQRPVQPVDLGVEPRATLRVVRGRPRPPGPAPPGPSPERRPTLTACTAVIVPRPPAAGRRGVRVVASGGRVRTRCCSFSSLASSVSISASRRSPSPPGSPSPTARPLVSDSLQRAVQLLGQLGEVVAQVALDPAEHVAGVLADLEA